jgi:hypothetical protein
MALAEISLAGLPDYGKSFGQKIFESLAQGQPAAKFGCFRTQRLIAGGFEPCLQAVDVIDDLREFLDLAFIGVSP